MDQLAGLTEKIRKLALDRFRLLQPRLEDDRPLKLVAAEAEIPFRTARRAPARRPQPSGSLIGRWANAAKRPGSPEISRAILSLYSRAIAIPSGPEIISAPGPGTESTCMRIPAVSIAAILSSPVSASACGLMALKEAVPCAGHPFRFNVAESIRLEEVGEGEVVFDSDDAHVHTHHGTVWPR
jgi:hypothetical protein